MAIFTSIATAIATAIGVSAAASATFIAITAAGLQIASGIAVSLIAKAVSGSGEQASQAFGVQGTLQAGGDIERSFMVGFGATAGSLVYANEWGNSGETPNAYLTQVICVGDLPVDSLAQVFVNGELVALADTAHPSMGYPVLEYRKDGTDHLWIKFHDGNQTVADSFLVGTVASTERPYAATRVGVGCPYVVATALVADELFSGFPTYKFALNGTPLYDPSKDDTVGGSGDQRWDDPTTWGGDGDHLPVVQAYNILRGMTFGGQWFYGLQNLPAARLPVASWIAQIEKCRAELTGADGPEPTYRAGGEIGINAPIADAIEAILTTCQGRLAETGGTYKIHVGAPEDPVFAFDDGDILSTEEQSFTPFFGLADTINGITAKYPSPAEGWNSKVAPPLYRSDFEALDGNRRLMADVSLDLVPYAGQAQRLMKSALEEARRARRHTITLPPDFWYLEPGDYGQWVSERNGYESKLFRVDGLVDKGNLDVIIDITEVDPADYDWDHDTDFHPPVDGPIVISRPTPQAVVDFSVSPATVYDALGVARRPTIQMFWNGNQPDVRAVLFEVRLKSTEVMAATGQITDVVAGASILPPVYLPATLYQARIKYQPNSDRATLWSDEPSGSWLDVTTPDVRLTNDDITGIIAELTQDQQNKLGLAFETGPGTLSERLDLIEAKIAEQAAAALSAQATDKVRTSALVVRSNGNSAAVLREETARIDADGALAELIEEVEASFGDSLAGGLLQFTATAGVGAEATISIRVRAQTGDDFADSGIFVVATSDGLGGTTSQILLKTDQLFVTDGVHSANAFSFDAVSGELKVLALRAGRITSTNGTSMVTDYDNPEFYMES